MDITESYYCRLCAELKDASNLLNLELDEEKRAEIVEKLNRVNAATDFCNELLPKGVCLQCVNYLDYAFDFVQGIENAQGILSRILIVNNIKEETLISISTDHTYSNDEVVDCEIELLDIIKDKNYEKEFYEPELDPPEHDDKVQTTNVKEESSINDSETLDQLNRQTKSNKRVNNSDTKKRESNNLPVQRKSNRKRNNSDTKSKKFDNSPLPKLKQTWSDYNWTCAHCGTQFPTVDELISHSIQYHSRCNDYRCVDCNKRRLKLDNFLTHVTKHRNYLKLSCYKCGKQFSSIRKVKLHVKEHLTENTCSGCNTSFTTSEELNNHVKSFCQSRAIIQPMPYVPNRDDLSCAICKKTFEKRVCLTKHLFIHSDRKRDHICYVCGKSFFHKKHLLKHLFVHAEVRKFQCKICKASFKSQEGLHHHVGVHDNKKPYSCEKCGRCFRLRAQLNIHSIIHTDALPHVCPYCNKGFRFKSRVSQHILQHTGARPYSCQICERDFVDWSNYNKHMKGRHGKDMAKKKRSKDGVYWKDLNADDHKETTKN